LPPKLDPDASPGIKLLRLFRTLTLDGRRHFQSDLARELECSAQSVIRMIGEIKSVVGDRLIFGLERRRRWYQIKTVAHRALGLEFEELRYLGVCRDLAANFLPEEVLSRIDSTILNLSMQLADSGFANRDKLNGNRVRFFSEGKIDYAPFYGFIETFLKAAETKEILTVSYKASGDAASRELFFAPFRFVSVNGALYVIGATVSEGNFSTIYRLNNLAVHRVTGAEGSGQFSLFDPPEMELDAFGLPWHEPKTFRIKFAPGEASDYIRERIWADNQKIADHEDGGAILTLSTTSEPELMAWVRSFGEEAVILPPLEEEENEENEEDNEEGEGNESGIEPEAI
jgi:hypothetical protein